MQSLSLLRTYGLIFYQRSTSVYTVFSLRVTRNSRGNNRQQVEQTLINLVQNGTFGTLVPFVPRVPLQKTAYFFFFFARALNAAPRKQRPL